MEPYLEFAARHPVLVLAFFGLLAALLWTEIARAQRGYVELSPLELTQLINRENALLIDVSPMADYDKAHILGAKNLPLSQFDPDGKDLAKAKERPVACYCRAGITSQEACRRLVRAGFGKVYMLKGGLASWLNDNLPVAKGRE